MEIPVCNHFFYWVSCSQALEQSQCFFRLFGLKCFTLYPQKSRLATSPDCCTHPSGSGTGAVTERAESPLPGLAPAFQGYCSAGCPLRLGSARLDRSGQLSPRGAGAAGARAQTGRLFPGGLWLGSCEPWLLKDGPQLSAVVSFAAMKTQHSAFKEQNLDNRCGGSVLSFFLFTWWFD